MDFLAKMPQAAHWMLTSAAILITWTLIVTMMLGRARFKAAKERRVDPEFYVLFQNGAEPDDVAKIARHYHNLLEAPVLFYALLFASFFAGLVDMVQAYLAAAYVALRLVHAAIHLGSNIVMRRFQVFALSMMVLLAMAVRLLIALFS